MAKRGDTFTGSITYNTGTADQDRFVYTDSAGQAAKTLIVASTYGGGDANGYPTVASMIKTDPSGFSTLGLHIGVVKTVSGQADIDFTVRRMYFWGGGDETHWCGLNFAGPGTNGLHARVGSIAIAYGSQLEFNSSQLVIDNMAVNTTSGAFIHFTSSEQSPWISPYGIVGVVLHVHSAASPAITTSNTWTIEMTWFYGD